MKSELIHIHKIAVFRALQLGDMLCSIPAIRSLRKNFPSAQITLIGLPWAKSFTERFSDIFDKFIAFPGYPGLPEQPFDEIKLETFLQTVRKEKYDLLIQMQGNGTVVNPLLMEFEAKHIAGFYNEESFVDSKLFMPYPNHGSEIHRHLLLMEHLGVPSFGDHLEFPITDQDQKSLNHLFLPVFPKNYVCIHPGSRARWRQWPPQYFAIIADYCIKQGFTVLITGTNEESDITSEVIKCMKYHAIDLTGRTNLGTMALLLKDAFALIANCTGVSHLADAFQIPSVIISMDGEPHRWAALNKKLHRVIDWTTQPNFEKVLMETHNLFHDLLTPKTS